MANHDGSRWCASSSVPIELPADSNDRPFKGAQHIGIHAAMPSSFNWCSLMVLGQSNASSTERTHTHNSRKIFFFSTMSHESQQTLVYVSFELAPCPPYISCQGCCCQSPRVVHALIDAHLHPPYSHHRTTAVFQMAQACIFVSHDCALCSQCVARQWEGKRLARR